nr:23S rRNA (adenosine(1067)-2'-O)-methyltransferase [Chlamydiota bacterium]
RSLQNSLVKRLVKLREDPHFRREEKKILVTSKKIISEIPYPPDRVFFTDENPSFSSEAENILVSDKVLQKITGLPSPDGVAAEFSLPPPTSMEGNSYLLACDRITDPGNLGTLIRTALALFWDGIVFLPGCVDPFHEKVLRASRGALFRLPYHVGTWEELTNWQKKKKATCYVADMEGIPLHKAPRPENLLLILSHEGEGVSPQGAAMGEKISIPISHKMESLNVSIAGSILLYELRRIAQ